MKNEFVNPRIMEVYNELMNISPEDPRYKSLVEHFANMVKAEMELAKMFDVLNKINTEEPQPEQPSRLDSILANGPLVTAIGSFSLGVVIIVAESLIPVVLNSKAVKFLR